VKGQQWERQIQEVLDAACAGLLLVSQDFLVSNFINNVELPRLLDAAQRSGKRVFWLHLSPSTVKDRVSKLMRALGARSRAEVVAVATRKGLIHVDAG